MEIRYSHIGYTSISFMRKLYQYCEFVRESFLYFRTVSFNIWNLVNFLKTTHNRQNIIGTRRFSTNIKNMCILSFLLGIFFLKVIPDLKGFHFLHSCT